MTPDNTMIILFVLVLAALVGAGVGGYLAVQQASTPVVRQMEDIRSEAVEFLKTAERKLESFTIEVPPVEVPQPVVKVEASISPWSAFWIFLATVAGIVGANMLRKSDLGKRLEISVAKRLTGGQHGKQKGKQERRHRRDATRASR